MLQDLKVTLDKAHFICQKHGKETNQAKLGRVTLEEYLSNTEHEGDAIAPILATMGNDIQSTPIMKILQTKSVKPHAYSKMVFVELPFSCLC